MVEFCETDNRSGSRLSLAYLAFGSQACPLGNLYRHFTRLWLITGLFYFRLLCWHLRLLWLLLWYGLRDYNLYRHRHIALDG